jgi:integrase
MLLAALQPLCNGGDRVKITKRTVEGLKAPKTGEAWLWDSDLRGFGVRARGARRTYLLRYPAPGRPQASRWVTIGHHGAPWRPDPATGNGRELTAELARDEALRLLGVLAGGGDPAQARDNVRGIPTLQVFGDTRYMPDHSDAKNAEKTARNNRRRLKDHIYPLLGKERLDRVTAAHVTRLHNSLKATPFEANRCLSLLSSMFNRAVLWRVLPAAHVNPCRGVAHFPERKRKRYLDAAERPLVGAALAAAEAKGRRPRSERKKGEGASAYAIAALRVLMLTGARPDEIVRLRRDQLAAVIDQKGKTGERPIFFGKAARAIIDALEVVPGNPYVFVGRRHGSHLTATGVSQLWKRIARAAGLDDVRLYDARHTFASVAIQRGKTLEEIGALLGHKKPETTQRYTHLADDPLRAANEEISDEIAAAFKD